MKKATAAIVVLCALWFYGGILVGHAIGTRQAVDRILQAEMKRESMQYTDIRHLPDTTTYVNGIGDTTIVITNPR